MKFLTDAPVTLEDKENKLKVGAIAATNELRYKLLDLGAGDADSMAKRVEMAEFIFVECITSISVKGKDIDPKQMVKADLMDEGSAKVYFSCVNLVVESYLAAGAEEEEAKK